MSEKTPGKTALAIVPRIARATHRRKPLCRLAIERLSAKFQRRSTRCDRRRSTLIAIADSPGREPRFGAGGSGCNGAVRLRAVSAGAVSRRADTGDEQQTIEPTSTSTPMRTARVLSWIGNRAAPVAERTRFGLPESTAAATVAHVPLSGPRPPRSSSGLAFTPLGRLKRGGGSTPGCLPRTSSDQGHL